MILQGKLERVKVVMPPFAGVHNKYYIGSVTAPLYLKEPCGSSLLIVGCRLTIAYGVPATAIISFGSERRQPVRQRNQPDDAWLDKPPLSLGVGVLSLRRGRKSETAG